MPFFRLVEDQYIAQPLPRVHRAVRAGPDLGPAKQRLKRYLIAQRRRAAYRPEVPHARPISTPRPREGGARMVAAAGRDGTGERDDGSGGDSDGNGGGSSEPSGPRSHAPFAGDVR